MALVVAYTPMVTYLLENSLEKNMLTKVSTGMKLVTYLKVDILKESAMAMVYANMLQVIAIQANLKGISIMERAGILGSMMLITRVITLTMKCTETVEW